jgi:hypothetical protein
MGRRALHEAKGEHNTRIARRHDLKILCTKLSEISVLSSTLRNPSGIRKQTSQQSTVDDSVDPREIDKAITEVAGMAGRWSLFRRFLSEHLRVLLPILCSWQSILTSLPSRMTTMMTAKKLSTILLVTCHRPHQRHPPRQFLAYYRPRHSSSSPRHLTSYFKTFSQHTINLSRSGTLALSPTR